MAVKDTENIAAVLGKVFRMFNGDDHLRSVFRIHMFYQIAYRRGEEIGRKILSILGPYLNKWHHIFQDNSVTIAEERLYSLGGFLNSFE